MKHSSLNQGILFALGSAALFGVSPSLAKMLVGDLSALMIAGLLYLGSGLGLYLVLLGKKQSMFKELKRLSKNQLYRLLGTIIFGGILAPLAFALGIKQGLAFEVSLLLNLESVTTTVFAWLIFREYIGYRLWLSKIFVLAGAVLLVLSSANGVAISPAGGWILAACIFWGIDNNLTRDLEELSPQALACIKGLVAGIFNTTLAIIFGHYSATFPQVISLLLIGSLSYGVSLIFFIYALRLIGSARTATYFAAGPFFGMLFAVFTLAEMPSFQQWGAALLMFVGVLILGYESHEHMHTHEKFSHTHKHIHDEHHQHEHDGSEGKEPHSHFHVHSPITHSHVHWPDIHHRHEH